MINYRKVHLTGFKKQYIFTGMWICKRICPRMRCGSVCLVIIQNDVLFVWFLAHTGLLWHRENKDDDVVCPCGGNKTESSRGRYRTDQCGHVSSEKTSRLQLLLLTATLKAATAACVSLTIYMWHIINSNIYFTNIYKTSVGAFLCFFTMWFEVFFCIGIGVIFTGDTGAMSTPLIEMIDLSPLLFKSIIY